MLRLLIATAVAALLGGVSPALAQDAGQAAAPAAGAVADAAMDETMDETVDAVAGRAEGSENAPAAAAAGSLRTQCEAELRRDDAWRAELRANLVQSIWNDAPEPGDAQWRAELKRMLAAEVHEEDAQLMLTNKRHVVMAYAVLWLLVLGFAVFLWVRQRGLKDEIARLEREIAQATAND